MDEAGGRSPPASVVSAWLPSDNGGQSSAGHSLVRPVPIYMCSGLLYTRGKRADFELKTAGGKQCPGIAKGGTLQPVWSGLSKGGSGWHLL